MKDESVLDRLLALTYERELELERKLETNLKPEMEWWFEDTKNLNIKLQIACLEEKEKARLVFGKAIRLQ